MAFSKLPKLKQPEPTNVSARVIDVFYRPQAKPVDDTVLLLAQSLDQLQPSLQKYSLAKEEVKEETDTALAKSDFNRNRKEFNKLIKDGELPEGASPYYINAYINAELRDKARQFNDELFSAYQNSNVQNDLDANAFGKFYVKFANSWKDNNGLDIYDQVNVAESFIPFADASRSNLENQHIQGRVALIEENQKNLLNKGVNDLIDDSVQFDDDLIDDLLGNFNIKNVDDVDKRLLFASLSIKEKIDDLALNGMNKKVANKVVVDSVVNKAIAEKDIELLEILNNVVTDEKSGAFLGGQTYASAHIESAKSKILQMEEDEIKYKNYLADREERDNLNEDIDTFFKHIQDGNGINVDSFIQTYTRKDGSKLTEGVNSNTLRTFGKAWLDSTKVMIEKDKVIQNIQLQIFTQPLKTDIIQQINQAMIEGHIKNTTGEQLLKQYFKAQETVESGYFQNRGFVRLEKGIEQFLLKGNPYPDADTTNMLDISMIEFYRYATNVIRALETKDEFKDMQDFEKEDYFFEKMIEKQQKLKRDLEAYSMADLDMESETQEKIDVTKSKNKKNIYED